MHEETPIQHPVVEPKKQLLTLPAAILLGAVIIALAIIFTLRPAKTTQAPTAPETPKSVPAEVATIRADDYIRGDANANIVVIEYSDSDCPFCERFHTTMQEAMKAYNGKVAWVYRYYPLESLHPNAYPEALALSCVGDLGGTTAFWNYLDKVMGLTLAPGTASTQTLTTLAVEEKVDKNLFTACLSKGSGKARIDTDIATAQSIGARGTPFSIVVNRKNGKQAIVPGALPLENLKQAIDSVK